MRLSMKASTESMKLLQWSWVWNPTTLEPSRPEISSSRHGQMPMRSALGHGMCQNMMMVARGSVSRIMRGASPKW